MSIKLIHFSVSSVFHFHRRRTISGNWNKGLLPTPQIRLEKTLGKWIGNMTNLPPQKNVVMIQISWNYVQYVQSQNIQSYTSYTSIFPQWSPQEVVHFPHLGSVTRGTEGHGPSIRSMSRWKPVFLQRTRWPMVRPWPLLALWGIWRYDELMGF